MLYEVITHLEDGDQVWVHDYQLLLLPQLIKEAKPNVSIGFFLHIPFPSYEIFRVLPKREELLKGMLGSDLIGFHNYDYERHFISSVSRILRYDVNFVITSYSIHYTKLYDLAGGFSTIFETWNRDFEDLEYYQKDAQNAIQKEGLILKPFWCFAEYRNNFV